MEKCGVHLGGGVKFVGTSLKLNNDVNDILQEIALKLCARFTYIAQVAAQKRLRLA
jgi:predicted transcriptional regulator